MPERRVHEFAAAVDAQLASDLADSQQPGKEWVPTLIFYTCIHLVESRLAEQGLHPEGHAARANAIDDEWGEAAADLFEQLRDLSEQWRYSGQAPSTLDVRAAMDWANQLLGMMGVDWPVAGFLPTEN